MVSFARVRLLAMLAAGLGLLGGCNRVPPSASVRADSPTAGLRDTSAPEQPVLRVTGTVQAVRSYSVRVPQISGQNSRLTLVRLIPNGSKVAKDDVLVEFDRTTLLDEEREAVAKLEEIGHQLEEKRAQIRNDAAKRIALLREAEADLNKAVIQLKKGPILSEIDRLKNEEKATSAKSRVESLKKSDGYRIQAEAAAVKILELKKQRQEVTLERIRSNMSRLIIKSQQDGMIALENIWRSGSMGPPQEGDQLWPGQPVLRLFDPGGMVVDALVNESDFAAVGKQSEAKLYLDAYPGATFRAFLETASPVATAGLDTPVRTFSARFRIEGQDPRLLPDLSAALEIPRLVPAPSPMAKSGGTPK